MAPFVGDGEQSQITLASDEIEGHVRFPPTPDSGSKYSTPATNGNKSEDTTIKDHLAWVIEHDSRLHACIGPEGEAEGHHEAIVVNGQDLSLAELVAVASFRAPVQVSTDEKVRSKVEASIDFLKRHLDEGQVVYGISTGFGGSADTRSRDFVNMQRALLQHQNSAVLLPSDLGREDAELSSSLSSLKGHSLPRTVVRGAMLARCNSLMRGHSAVRLSVIEVIATLLNRDFVPIIPLRGSISACGDLTPLSYIAGALEGNSDIYLDCRMEGGKRETLSADQALHSIGLVPTTLMPKEGLGLMNGTAVSCAAGTLALHETQYLVLASQVLTAMCTEALRGSSDNFHPFISDTRPHSGQREVAENVHRQLKQSRLVVGKDAKTAGLYQDRYALRTASQWIGPQLEDLSLAVKQLAVELNSTTDNPLIDAEEGAVHHGGNFQAVAVTSAMEKARLSLQMLGKLMFAQSSELINPMLNGILPPNLCFDDPSLSFTFKGVDINMASYMSELAFLANPVSSHVQSAEMHNQAVNSLALISARYTLDAVELVSLMTSAYLYTVCQALDLHVLCLEYFALIEKEAQAAFNQTFDKVLPVADMEPIWNEVQIAIRSGLATQKTQDTPQRAHATAEMTVIPITKAIMRCPRNAEQDPFYNLQSWVAQLTQIVADSIRSTRTRFASSKEGQGPTTLEYLGHGSATMYRYIRHDLEIPLHKGLVEHPTYPECRREGVDIARTEKLTIGTRISTIYSALRSGRMHSVLIKCLM